MKKIILLIILFCGFTAQAQYGYGNNERQQRQRNTPQIEQKAPDPTFNVKKYIGIVIYDIKKAAKKSSIKLASKEGKQFSEILTVYNKRIKDITRINSFLLSSTKKMVENFQKKAIKTKDFSNQPKVQKKMNENLKPLKEVLKKEDKNLDTSIKNLLSKKQYKKWIKYNKKLYKVFLEE